MPDMDRWTSAARAADASQAAYFWELLADERAEVLDILGKSRAILEKATRDDVVKLRHLAPLRAEVSELDARRRELERMITALDRRYSASWAKEG